MIFTLLTVLFIGLKLTGYIEWSWFLVVAPSIIQLFILFSFLIIYVVAAFKRY